MTTLNVAPWPGQRPPKPHRYMTAVERFHSSYVIPQGPGCWIWVRRNNGIGYGNITWGGAQQYAHRVAYEMFVGPIPAGLTIDHLCRTPACVNPRHLEAVTKRENTLRGNSPAALHARQDHCVYGHPFNKQNTYRWRNRRYCKSCKRDRDIRYRAERNAA